MVSFTGFSTSGAIGQPPEYVAADGYVGTPTISNTNSPTFSAAAFPFGIASGTVISAPNISGGTIHGSMEILTVPVSAVSATATAYTLSVPAGGYVVPGSLSFVTQTAFTGATVSGALGSAAGDASYVPATSVKAAGITSLTLNSNAATVSATAPAISGGLVFTLEQTTPTAVGSGTLLVGFVVP